MSEITVNDVEKYLALANLSLNPEETRVMADQLGTIVDYVQKIAELDLSGIEPTFQVLQAGAEHREDAHRPGLGSDAAMNNAPDVESDHFLVPKVINVKG